MNKKIITRAKIVLLCLALVCLAISLGSFFKEVPTVMAQNSAVTYSADFSNGLPYDWVEYNRSDVTKLEAPQKSGNNLILTHDITRSNERTLWLAPRCSHRQILFPMKTPT